MSQLTQCDQCEKTTDAPRTDGWLILTLPSYYAPQEDAPGHGFTYPERKLDFCSRACATVWLATKP